jgi:hypothetical protein
MIAHAFIRQSRSQNSRGSHKVQSTAYLTILECVLGLVGKARVRARRRTNEPPVILFFWPMRASSENQTSIDRALSLLVMTGTSRELTISHGAQFPALTETIKRELRRRSAVEPVIGHAKAEHRMGRNYLVGTQGDAANAVLATAGYNFRRGL